MQPNRNQRILKIVFVVFTLLVAIFAYDMARRTTAPWKKKKQLVRALPVTDEPDSVVIDTIRLK